MSDNETTDATDVLVLGAGPAGTAAAVSCAQAGLRTLVVERAAFPRPRPGETLPPGVESLLRQLGVWAELTAGDWIRHTGHWVQQGNETRFEAFGSDVTGAWQGFQVERGAFDTLLLAAAQRLGVRIVQPCRLEKLLCRNGRAAGVHTSEGTLLARYLVDATGSARWLARQLGLAVSVHSPPLRARYGYAAGQCAGRDAAPLWQGDTNGWTWTACVRPGLYHWTRLWFDAANERSAPIDWYPEEYRPLNPQGKVRGVDVTWRAVDVPAAPGYFLVGDAAFLLDPAASHGVLKALMSGMMAAHAIRRIERDHFAEIEAQRAYALWLKRWFQADAAKLAAVYAALQTRL